MLENAENSIYVETTAEITHSAINSSTIDCTQVAQVQEEEKEEEKESLVMDFSTAFKSNTRRGKKKKGIKKVANSDQPTNGTDELEPDALDEVNRDLED